jgi:alpha-mannosidase
MMPDAYLCMHFHCDPIFTCPQAVHIAESVDLARQYVDIFRDEPGFRCILSEIDYVQGYWTTHAKDRDLFLRMMREGKIETSGSYSEPNESSVGGEALVRNFVYGQWFLVDYLGAEGSVYMPFDVFGHTRQLPQLLRKAGMNAAIWTKGSPSDPNPSIWVAPDGSRVVNQVSSYGHIDWGTSDQLDNLIRGRVAKADRLASAIPELAFRGSDFVSPPWWVVGGVDRLRENGIELSTPSKYIADISERHDKAEPRMVVTAREMTQYHVGTGLSRTELKIGHRLGEQIAIEAETWCTLATLFGEQYPDAVLDHAWRQLLYSQHHDSITGTSNDQSYLDLMSHLHEAVTESTSARETGLSALASRVRTDESEGEPVVVFNSTSLDRTEEVFASVPSGADAWEAVNENGESVPAEPVETPRGRQVRFVARDVPGVGHRTWWLRKSDGVTSHGTTESADEQVVIETPFARVTFDPRRGGGITSIIESESGRELIDTRSPYTANDLVCLKEGPGAEPSWEMHTSGGKFFSSTVAATVTAVRDSAGCTVTASHPFPDTDEVVRTVRLSDHSPRIDCTVDMVGYSGSRSIGEDRFTRPWGGTSESDRGVPEDRDMFGIYFPIGLDGMTPMWSDRFGQRAVRRSEGWLDYRTHQRTIESGCAMYSADQWIAATPSIAIVTDESGPTPMGVPLSMVRVVVPAGEFNDERDGIIEALAVRGITATPGVDSENTDSDLFQTKQVIALGGPSVNTWSAAALEGRGTVGSTRALGEITTETGRVIPTLVISGDEAEISREVEALLAQIAVDRITVSGGTDCTCSVRLDNAGLGVLNRGTIAASCENDGSLFMALQHSAYWCDWATPFYLGSPFVPERKTTRYEYAIVPFAGSWRDAHLPEVAQAYNRPMIARSEDRHGGSIDSKRRWLGVEGDGAMLSALKPAGHSAASMTGDVMDASRGTIVRVWNWSGNSSDVRIATWTGVESALITDLAERHADPLTVTDGAAVIVLGANAVETAELVLVNDGFTAPDANAALPDRRIESRWWLDNLGAAPLGNMAASVTLSGDLLPGESGLIELSVTNNRSDAPLKAEIEFACPDGWKIEPPSLFANLAPMGAMTVPVSVTTTCAGRLQAMLPTDGGTYTDTLEIGEVALPRVMVELTEDGVSVDIANESADNLVLRAEIVTPLEAWTEGLSLLPVDFAPCEVRIAAGDESHMDIPVSERFASESWAFVKISGHGRASYHRVPIRAQVSESGQTGAPITLHAALADVSFNAVPASNGIVSFTASLKSGAPAGVTDSPVLDVLKYWIVEPVENAGGLESSSISFGVIPSEIRSLESVQAARISLWQDGQWVEQPTVFDEQTWTLNVNTNAEMLGSRTIWTITGASCIEWQTRLGGRFFESAAWTGDIDGDGNEETVIGTAWNQVCMLNVDGTVRWRRRFGGWAWPSAQFAVADVTGDGFDEIIAAPPDRTLALLDRDGRFLWRKDNLPLAVKTTPVVHDINADGLPEILVSINDDGLRAFSADGRELWHHEVGRRISSAAVVDRDGTRILVSEAGRALRIIAADGSLIDRIEFAQGAATERLVPPPVPVDGPLPGIEGVLFAGHDGILRLLSHDGVEIWSIDLETPLVSEPIIMPRDGSDDPFIVIAGMRQKVFGITLAGEIVWTRTFNANIQGAPVAADMDGDGHDEIIVGAGRDMTTYVLRRDGSTWGSTPFCALWALCGAATVDDGAGRSIVLGGLNEHAMRLRPFRS